MRSIALLSLFTLTAAACGETGGTGRAQIFVAAEDTIPNGLEPGTDAENIADGWTVTYDKFLVAVGNFRAARSADAADKLTDPRVFIVDLKTLPSEGLVIADFMGAKAVRWDKVGFDLPNATSAALRADNTAQADYDRMVQGNFSLYVEGTLSKPATQSVSFRWGLKAGTAFDDCAPPQGDAGFAVPAGGTVQIKPTIHGDHWFFTNITQGAEMTTRLAQWVASADEDRNGGTTIDELKRVRASDVFPSPPYNISGAIIPIVFAHDYLEAQARTLGDFQGDGECPTRRIL
jgi:hypothetical protein